MRIPLATVLLAASTLLAGCSSSGRGPAQESCPVCRKPIADGPEVRVIRSGEVEPGTRYRCFMCPIVQGETGQEWTLRAESGLDRKWVTFHVIGNRVVAEPPTAVVLAQKVEAGEECLDVHRVFTDEPEFRRYVETHPAVKEAKSRRLEDVLAENRR